MDELGPQQLIPMGKSTTTGEESTRTWACFFVAPANPSFSSCLRYGCGPSYLKMLDFTIAVGKLSFQFIQLCGYHFFIQTLNSLAHLVLIVENSYTRFWLSKASSILKSLTPRTFRKNHRESLIFSRRNQDRFQDLDRQPVPLRLDVLIWRNDRMTGISLGVTMPK